LITGCWYIGDKEVAEAEETSTTLFGSFSCVCLSLDILTSLTDSL
jgi:hypothetical protein